MFKHDQVAVGKCFRYQMKTRNIRQSVARNSNKLIGHKCLSSTTIITIVQIYYVQT